MTTDPLALPAFILSIVSLVVAVIGAGTGVAALVWQIVTRTRGAHRVVVKVNSNMTLIIPGSATRSENYIEVLVRNRGAAAVQLQSWSILLPDGKSLFTVPAQFPPAPALPHMLDAGASVSFYTLASSIADAAKGRDLSKARAVAHLATGQDIRGRRGEISA